MPHSTQIRVRCVGSGVFDEKRRFRNDIRVSRYSDEMLSYGTRRDGVPLIPANPLTGRSLSLDPRIRQKVGTSRTTTDTYGASRVWQPHRGLMARLSRYHRTTRAALRCGKQPGEWAQRPRA